MTVTEREVVLAHLTSDRFADKAVAQVWATLLDEGTYLCSMSTMLRILRENAASVERRRQATHPPRKRPELVAYAPVEVWSWEDGNIAKELITAAMGHHGIPHTVHADRGTAMTSKPVARLLVDLGIDRSHSRPRTSNDNPYIESSFKTMKYPPVFPERFKNIEHARAFMAEFVTYYNHVHRHAGIGLHTPATVHFSTAIEIRRQRQVTLDAAYQANPTRFERGRPTPPKLPEAA